MAAYFELDDVDAFTAGAIGRPGQRVFYLQARADGRRVTIKCEKQQAGALGQYLDRLLEDLPTPDGAPIDAALELMTPLDAVFVLGPIGLGYDTDLDRFVIVLEEVVPVDDDGEPLVEAEDRGKVRFRITRSQARAFARKADEVVAAGRASCVFCGQPMDPDGHPCPRMN